MTLTTLVAGVRETRDLAEGTYLIGRGSSCRIRFNAPEVSERHALLTVRGGNAMLEDLHSANGTSPWSSRCRSIPVWLCR